MEGALQRNRICLASLLLIYGFCASSLCMAQLDEPIAPVAPIQIHSKIQQEKLNLGKQLYTDTLFSKDLSHACYSCHSLKKAGTDRLPRYIGLNKKEGTINTPTVLNASFNFRQFWDGRAKTLKEVIEDHLKDNTVFANNWSTVIQRIKENAFLADSFKKIYKEGITANTIKDALTVYLESLVTTDSAFDKYLKGDQSALSDDQKKGYRLFKYYGCITCHQGMNAGGNLLQKMGIYQDYFAKKPTIAKSDLGYFNYTGKEEDKYVFKIPTLRNVALTAPYLHDGSVNTLADVVQMMAIYEVGQPIPAHEVPYIVKFLESLSGKLPETESSKE